MTPVGEPYAASGSLDVRSILTTVILGTVTAILGAVLIWAWEISPLPTLVIMTAIIQGMIVGWAMAYMIGRLRMRNPRIAGVIGFGCGLLSITLVHFGHYLSMCSAIETGIRQQIAEDKGHVQPEKDKVLARLNADPAPFVNAFFVEQTGSPGFLGSLKWRNREGVLIKGHKTDGILLWLLWAGEALFVAITAAAMSAARAKQPFCEECGDWCVKQPDVLVLPGAATERLVTAVREDNAKEAAALQEEAIPEDGTGKVGATLHACPHCDQAFADLSLRVSNGKETQVHTRLNQVRISPEMALVLRGQHRPSVEEPDEVPADDAPAAEAPLPPQFES